MPIYEYYCSNCGGEYELLRPVSQATETAPCATCGEPGERQLSTFSFKSNSFTAPNLKHSTTKPLRSHDMPKAPPSLDSPA
ncbi:MAG: hypothetical protein BZY88_17000 [SAR202 cluster bacterium Io17-Chloro-G9]|nr:MAG: hypothetical protein BZY88_17000 [SAR202 cluster bacterium Io17-Chloro-G9]